MNEQTSGGLHEKLLEPPQEQLERGQVHRGNYLLNWEPRGVRREVGYCWLPGSTSGEGSRVLGWTPRFSASSAGSRAKGKRFE